MTWILIAVLAPALYAALLPSDVRGTVAGLIASMWMRMTPGRTDRKLRNLTTDGDSEK